MSSLQMLWAYGRSLFALEDEVKKIIPMWQSVYDELNAGTAFQSPKEMFQSIGLYQLTQQTSYDYLKKAGIKDRLVYEFVDCISRVNYHQDGNINAFADMVSLAGAGMDGGELFSVADGNDRMITSTLKAKNVTVKLGEEVQEISSTTASNRTEHILTNSAGGKDTFDIVVIACPLDLADIAIPQYDVITNREFQTVHAHFVAGDINYAYFNDVKNAPQTIFTIENSTIPFVSIAKTGFASEWEKPIYKVFSRKKLGDDFFSQTFTNIQGQLHQEWKAYTVLSPSSKWPPFKIGDGLFYINAMESAVSAMETEAVAARNVANLTIDHLTQRIQD